MPARPVLVACCMEVGAEGVELVWCEGRFDPAEHGSLLVAHVISEQLAELVERPGVGVWVAF